MTKAVSVFGKRLRAARKAKSLSQAKLGAVAGVDPLTAGVRINRYENGAHAPDYSIAQRLAAVLEVPTAYLYCEDDDLAELILWYHGLSVSSKAVVRNKAKELIDLDGAN